MTSPPNTAQSTSPALRGSAARSLAERMSDPVLSVVRVVVAFLFISHGAQKLFGVLGGVDGQGGTVALTSWPAWWAGVIEVVAGGLVLLGLFTRSAATLCTALMAVAYFGVHQPEGLHPLQNGGEPALLFCVIFLMIAVLGPGRFALDTLLVRARADHQDD